MRGSASLHRTFFLVMGIYLQRSPTGESIYQFMGKKRSEGKPHLIYMMASANKFLHICRTTVKTYLDTLEQGGLWTYRLLVGRRAFQKSKCSAAWFCVPFLLCEI